MPHKKKKGGKNIGDLCVLNKVVKKTYILILYLISIYYIYVLGLLHEVFLIYHTRFYVYSHTVGTSYLYSVFTSAPPLFLLVSITRKIPPFFWFETRHKIRKNSLRVCLLHVCRHLTRSITLP